MGENSDRSEMLEKISSATSVDNVKKDKSEDQATVTSIAPGLRPIHQELQTVSIGDYTPIIHRETKHPFSEDLYPQGSVNPKFNKEGKKAKFEYIEQDVHGRSIDEKASSGKVIWHVKGNTGTNIVMGARDLKGARHEMVAIVVKENLAASNTAPETTPENEDIQKHYYSRIRAAGLYDETDVDYLVKATEYLIDHGIPTENIVNIYQIHEVIFDGKRMPLEEWAKENVIAYAKAQAASGEVNGAKLKEIADFAYKTEFYQVERELQVSERIRDLSRCTTEDEFLSIIETPIKWINAVGKATGEGIIPGTPKPPYFEIEGYKEATDEAKARKKESIKGYLGEWLPSQMGTYLGKLRKAGAKNDYGHAQQWSLAATMYDGQSFVGKEINGEELVETDYIASLREALGVLEELFMPNPANFIQTEFGDQGETLEKAKVNLIVSYLKEIGFPDIPDELMYNYTNLCDNTFYNGHETIYRHLEPHIFIDAMKEFGIELSKGEVKYLYIAKSKLIDIQGNLKYPNAKDN